MYRVLYAGFDTLDVSYQGALSETELRTLREAQKQAKATKQDQYVEVGPEPFRGMLKGHGMSGGYAFVITDGPTGAIFAIKDSTNSREWNLSVSVRALRLLTHGYEATKHWIAFTLAAMGCRIQDHSVRRIDYAVDIYAPGFELDMAKFIAPAQSKIRPYWSKEQDLDEEGNRPSGVFRGRSFESVTIGKMPGRQLTVYDKRRAVIDLRQPYWFEAWGVDPTEPNLAVFRVETRAGRDAMAKRMLKRSFAAVEADIGPFVQDALSSVRYVADKCETSNVTRSAIHPLWALAQGAGERIPFDQADVLPEARALEIMRTQRREMSLKQGFGCLMNTAILDGASPQDMSNGMGDMATRFAHEYRSSLSGSKIEKKAEEIRRRLHPFLDQ